METVLSGHVIAKNLVHDVEECMRNCFRNFNCVSFNFEYAAQGMKMCELNDSTKERSKDSIVKKNGFLHYGLTFF